MFVAFSDSGSAQSQTVPSAVSKLPDLFDSVVHFVESGCQIGT